MTGPMSPLTRRELEVVRLVAIGCGNREIAERLQRAESTVRAQVSTAMRRLHARDRAHLCSLLDDLHPGWRPPLRDLSDSHSVAFRLRMIADEVESAGGGVPDRTTYVPLSGTG